MRMRKPAKKSAEGNQEENGLDGPAGGSILLYGLGIIDLLRFLLLFNSHIIVGWVYVMLSLLRLPRASDARPITRNPFDSEKPAGPSNPFSS